MTDAPELSSVRADIDASYIPRPVPRPAYGSLDVAQLFQGGGLFRYRTRNSYRPVSRFRRLGDMVLGGIVTLAAVSGVVIWKSGVM